MHRRQLVDEVARRSGAWGLSRREVREALHGILDGISDQMAEGNAVAIAGFGRFEAKEDKGRRTLVRDGEEHKVASDSPHMVAWVSPRDSARCRPLAFNLT